MKKGAKIALCVLVVAVAAGGPRRRGKALRRAMTGETSSADARH